MFSDTAQHSWSEFLTSGLPTIRPESLDLLSTDEWCPGCHMSKLPVFQAEFPAEQVD